MDILIYNIFLHSKLSQYINKYFVHLQNYIHYIIKITNSQKNISEKAKSTKNILSKLQRSTHDSQKDDLFETKIPKASISIWWYRIF